MKGKSQGLGHVSPAGSVGVRRLPLATNAPTSKNATHFTERVPLSNACYETYHIMKQGKDGKGMGQKQESTHNNLLPERGNPLSEMVTYKIGSTLYEVSTSCGGSELLYDKMKRLIKAESVKTPADKKQKSAIMMQPVCRAFIIGGMNT